MDLWKSVTKTTKLLGVTALGAVLGFNTAAGQTPSSSKQANQNIAVAMSADKGKKPPPASGETKSNFTKASDNTASSPPNPEGVLSQAKDYARTHRSLAIYINKGPADEGATAEEMAANIKAYIEKRHDLPVEIFITHLPRGETDYQGTIFGIHAFDKKGEHYGETTLTSDKLPDGFLPTIRRFRDENPDLSVKTQQQSTAKAEPNTP